MKWNDPVYPPTQEKILYDKRGNEDGKRLESQPSMSSSQYALIHFLCAMKQNPVYAERSANELVEEAVELLDHLINETVG